MSVCKTTNGGISWPMRSFPGNEGDYGTMCKAIAVAPSNPSIVYAGGQQNYYAAVFQSSDSGDTWIDITEGLGSMLSMSDSVNVIWVSPIDPRMILAGTSRGVFKRAVFGRGLDAAWSPTAIQHSTVAFACDSSTGVIYAATASGVFETDDAGLTWRGLNDGLSCLDTLCIALDSDNDLLYVGTNGGSVWRLALGPLDPDGGNIVNLGE